MRNSVSPEAENRAIEMYVAGNSVRQINEKTGISTGSISNIIKKFSEKLEQYDVHAMHEFYGIIKKLKLSPDDALKGFATHSILSQNNIESSNEFIKQVITYAKKKDIAPEQLVSLCEKILCIQSKTDTDIDRLEDYCNELVEKKNALESKITECKTACTDSKEKKKQALNQYNVTQDQLARLDHVISFLWKKGLKPEDTNSLYNMLQNAHKEEYDTEKIIEFLKHDQSLDQIIYQKESKSSELDNAIKKKSDHLEQISLKYENLQLRHKSLQESAKSIELLRKNGVNPESIPVWATMFDSAGLNAKEFEKEIAEIGSIQNLINLKTRRKSKLGADIVALQKKKSWLEKKADNLRQEISNWTNSGKKSLKEITNIYESQIRNATASSEQSIKEITQQNKADVEFLKKQIMQYIKDTMQSLEDVLEKSHKMEHRLGKMESLKPLFDLVNGRFDPVPSITQTAVILDRLQIGIKNSGMDRHFIASDIKRLREKLIDLLGND